ncbi:MAG: 5'-nucleotidase C-terminal domain-containing protein [Acidobacteria bacterium]|nr:5'-nucleotidase C-terminal domain-containing protein [Acidobacteriota bacterium]
MMRVVGLVLALLALATPVAGSGSGRALQAQEDVGAPRAEAPLTLLQINDVYSTVPIGGRGGLARVATLKQRLAAAGRTPFLILAGDFLSSSVASTVFKGEQMIAALNAAGLDLATLGNHEFDFGVDVLIQRMAEARWQWLVANIVDVQTGKPIGGAAPYVVRTFGTLKVGFLGLSPTTEGIGLADRTRLRLIDPLVAAGTYLPMLKAERVDVVVVVTHLTFADDRALAERFPEIDIIIGGHEHFPIAAAENRTLISKAGADARFLARIDVNRRPSGAIERFYELVPVTGELPDEPGTAAVVASYEARLGGELDVAVGTSAVPLDGVSQRLRSSETNLGNLVADVMRADTGADIALVNSGGIRGDRVFGAGALTRRTLLEIHPFGNVVCMVAVPGRIVLAALDNGVSRLPAAAGQFPQVSGLTLRVNPRAAPGSRVSDVRIGGELLDPAKTYTLAIPDFLLTGGDNYTMFAGVPLLISPLAGHAMVAAFEAYLVDRREIAPVADGRILIAR